MPITDEELKAIFRANDYTTYVPKYDVRTATAKENKVHSRAKELFYKSWCGQLRSMGGKVCHPNKNGHRKASKNGMNRILSFVFERRPHLFHGSLDNEPLPT